MFFILILRTKIITIFGGKLTDCVNVGEEIVEYVRKLGISIPKVKKWYGEDDKKIFKTFESDFKQLIGVTEDRRAHV